MHYELAGMDLADVRFAVSPLNELVLSLRAWRDPGRYPVHLPWLRRVQQARPTLDGEMLLALTNDSLWTPDYLTPRPGGPLTRIDDELAAVAAVDDATVAHDLAEVHPHGLPAALRGPVPQVRRRIDAALTAYWDACVAPVWPRMRAVLQADVVHRGTVISARGAGAMFADLAERVSFADGVVSVQLTTQPATRRRSTTGVGLTLVPTLFTRGASCPIDPAEPPVIMYGARGTGTLWEAARHVADDALVAVLGRARAGLLTALEQPASSTDLARRLDVTASAVNQHLRVLRDAGLLTSARAGRSVLYLRSEVGDALVGGGREAR
ncbi:MULTISPECIES: ArsR/SmtB family transcription factor [unclassified Isoptericola]|uniref:ArsR/SmtB family transcription factor n=1 Tax=unclassified Isoptericola TaxID=2623355 RepID=UPI003661C9BA